MSSSFVHLRVHSAYSLAEGALRLKELAELCKKHDMPAVAVTDTNNLFGALEFAGYASDAGIQPIIGCQFALTRPGEGRALGLPKPPDELVLLAQNEQGYKNLMLLSSQCFLDTPPELTPQLRLEALQGHSEGLICLTGGLTGTLARLLQEGQRPAAEAFVHSLQAVFPDRLYIELQRHGLAEQAEIEPQLITLADTLGLPLVATNNCFFGPADMYEAHDALLCIAQGRLIADSDRKRITPEHRFKTASEMQETFADLPDALANTLVIAQRCAYMPKKGKPILPPFPTQAGRSEEEELRAQAADGLELRLRTNAITERAPYDAQLAYELDVIIKMGFAGYFLIVADFIKWAKAQDIPVGPGRGSGAGSLVAYSLTITDVDPLRFGLIFERFLNPERVSMPDFDVDFCQDRRDEVIHYVQQRYGREKVAQIITFGKLQARAVLRDVGRVLGLPWGQVDKLCKLVPQNPTNPLTLAQALEAEPQLKALVQAEESNQRLIKLASKLEGLYRHAGTHAGGVIIGDRPLQEIVALYRDPRSEMPVTQFHFKDAEKVGLVKFDFLGLKTISAIKLAIDMIAQIDGTEKIDLQTLPLDDRKTYELLGRAEVLGVFQVESAGMRDILRQMKPDRLEDMIALVALYRPGPMDSIPTYIAVKNGKQKPDYMHPAMEPVLKSTYGVLVYQEQVMEAAKRLAGYTLGGADLLRRAMGKKIKSEMDAQRAVFLDGCAKNNVPAEVATLIFDKMEKFSSYGFNIGHAAPYALIAYQTAYLKANHPAEFIAASMTYEIGSTDKLGQFKQECARMNLPLLPPDINASFADFQVEKLADGRKAVRYALGAIKGVGAEAMRALARERSEHGVFKNWADFFRRVDLRAINRKSLESLIKAGAFDSLLPNRAQLQAGLELMQAYGASEQQERSSGQNSLFGAQDSQPPQLPKTQPWDSLTRLQEEFSVIGFFLSAHPLDQHTTLLRRMMIVPSADLAQRAASADVTRFRLAGVILARQERTSKSGNRFAFVQASDSTGLFEFTAFSEILATSRALLEAGRRIIVTVDVQLQEEGMRLTAVGLEPLEAALDRQQGGFLIRLSSAESLLALREKLQSGQGVKRVVDIALAPLGAPEIEIRLPQGCSLSQADQQQLLTLPGIDAIETI